MMVRQLEEELRLRMRGPSIEMQQQMEVLYNENEHLTREIAILRDTIKVSSMTFIIFLLIDFLLIKLDSIPYKSTRNDILALISSKLWAKFRIGIHSYSLKIIPIQSVSI